MCRLEGQPSLLGRALHTHPNIRSYWKTRLSSLSPKWECLSIRNYPEVLRKVSLKIVILIGLRELKSSPAFAEFKSFLNEMWMCVTHPKPANIKMQTKLAV